MSTNIGFVILTWNSEKYIEDCLKAIISTCSSNHSASVVVVDNGSCDTTLQRIESFFESERVLAEHKLFQLEKNYGTTISRNIGIRYLLACQNKPEYICILDSDTIINQQAIQQLISVLENDGTCAIVGPRMHNVNMVYQHSGRRIPTLTEKIWKILPVKALQAKATAQETNIAQEGSGSVTVGYLMSACWMMRSDLFDKIGLLDEKIFYAPEDVDFCIRAWKNGMTVRYCYDADIIHHWQRLSRKKLFSKHNYEHIKGLAYMFWKHKYLFDTRKFNGNK